MLVVQEHANAAAALTAATAEAQTAEGITAFLAAELQQLHLEIGAKQVQAYIRLTALDCVSQADMRSKTT